MGEIEIPLPKDSDAAAIERAIDMALDSAGLGVTLKDTLKQYPGCIHWHAKRGRKPGTLELTMLPTEHRAWFSVHENRRAAWIAESMERVRDTIISQLKE